MLPDDIEHIDRRPSPIKKQKEKVIFFVFVEENIAFIFEKNSLDYRLCMSIRYVNVKRILY